MPFMPAEPRLRHCNLNLSIGSIFPLLFSIFLHFCFISESDLAVAAMLFLYSLVNKYGALSKSRRFWRVFCSYYDNSGVSITFKVLRAQRLKRICGRDPFNQNSNRSDWEKRTTSKGGPVFSKLFRLDRTDPLSFGPKFPESLVEWIAPCDSPWWS